jgi:hypothetical protein
MNKYLVVTVSILVFIVLVLGVMALFLNFGYSTIVHDSACSPPCWHRIVPGRTSTWQAQQILEEMNVSMTPWSDYGEDGTLSWFFRYPIHDAAGFAYSQGGVVQAISIQTRRSLTLEDAFDRIGEPAFYWTAKTQVEGDPWLEIYFVNDERGFVVKASQPRQAGTEPIEITANTLVDRVIYFQPGMFDRIFDADILEGMNKDSALSDLQPWDGYGAIFY